MTHFAMHDTRGLSRLGWDRHAAAVPIDLPAGTRPARVIAQHRSRWIVGDGAAEWPARMPGRARLGPADDIPAVGDWVAVGATGEIAHRLPRHSALVRRAAGRTGATQVLAANVDTALILAAADAPVNERRIERLCAIAWDGGALPIVVLTKADACDDVEAAIAALGPAPGGAEVLAVSSVTGAGVPGLLLHLERGSTAVLLGASGVGKSTLANRLLHEERLPTGALRADGKGRHTTTHRQLVGTPAGVLLIDTPGLREIGLVDDHGVMEAFTELERMAADCRFRDCRHEREPGCAVLAAVDAGLLERERLEHWHALRREAAALHRRRDPQAAAEARAEDRRIHRAARRHIRDKRRGPE